MKEEYRNYFKDQKRREREDMESDIGVVIFGLIALFFLCLFGGLK